MRRLPLCSVYWIVVVSALAAAASARADNALSIEPLESWSNVFGGSEPTFHYAIATDRPTEGGLAWQFSVEGRTILRGEVAFRSQPGRPAVVAVPLRIPQTKPGVIIAGDLEVAIAAGAGTSPARHEKTLWIFPQDPFYDRAEWLAGLKIALFDPEGKTAGTLEKAKVPFRRIARTAALDSVAEGMLVVGEGTLLADLRGLPEALVRRATSGVAVLCLAPADGSWSMPSTDDAPAPQRLALHRTDVITALDKRLDATAWPPDGPLVAASLAIRADRGRVVLQVEASDSGKAGAGWSWVEARYPKPGAGLVICGFGIIRQWDAGPAPRFMLARLFEHLEAKQESEPTPQPSED